MPTGAICAKDRALDLGTLRAVSGTAAGLRNRVVQFAIFFLLLAATARAQEDYQWQALFDPGLEPTYKDCEQLQRQVSQREEQRSAAHSRCLQNVDGDCPDDPRTGCSCIRCGKVHGADSYLQNMLKACMEAAQLALERRRQEEERQRNWQQNFERYQESQRELAATISRSLNRASERSNEQIEKETSGPVSRRNDRVSDPQPASPAVTKVSEEGLRIVQSMPDFDVLLGVKGRGSGIVVDVAENWGLEFGQALEASAHALDVAGKLVAWDTFLAKSQVSSPTEGLLDRPAFVVDRVAQVGLPAPSAFAFSRALSALERTTEDLTLRLQLSVDLFDSGAASRAEVNSASDFSGLGLTIGYSACPWCEHIVRLDAVARGSWKQFSTFVSGQE